MYGMCVHMCVYIYIHISMQLEELEQQVTRRTPTVIACRIHGHHSPLSDVPPHLHQHLIPAPTENK